MFTNYVQTAHDGSTAASGHPTAGGTAARFFRLPDPGFALCEVERRYGDRAEAVDHAGGLGMTFGDWRFTLRPEADHALRLAVETRCGSAAAERRSAEVAGLLASC